MKERILNILIISLGLLACNQETDVEPNLKLWYSEPADASVPDSPNGWKDDPEWLKALRIQLNEETMWSGSPDDNDNPEAALHQDKIRQLLFEGKYREATELSNSPQICKCQGSGFGNGANVSFGCFQTFSAGGQTGIHVQVINQLRNHFNLDVKPIKIIKPYQMLGEIEDDLLDIIGGDVIGLNGQINMFGIEQNNWTETNPLGTGSAYAKIGWRI